MADTTSDEPFGGDNFSVIELLEELSGNGMVNLTTAGNDFIIYDPTDGSETFRFTRTTVVLNARHAPLAFTVKLAVLLNDALCKRPETLERQVDGWFYATAAGYDLHLKVNSKWANGPPMFFAPCTLTDADREAWNEASLNVRMVSSYLKAQRIGAKHAVLPIWLDPYRFSGSNKRKLTVHDFSFLQPAQGPDVTVPATPTTKTPGACLILSDNKFVWSTADAVRQVVQRGPMTKEESEAWLETNKLETSDDGDPVIGLIRAAFSMADNSPDLMIFYQDARSWSNEAPRKEWREGQNKEGLYECRYCPSLFKSRAKANSHMAKDCEAANPSDACRKCNESFAEREMLIEHQKTCETWKCRKCGAPGKKGEGFAGITEAVQERVRDDHESRCSGPKNPESKFGKRLNQEKTDIACRKCGMAGPNELGFANEVTRRRHEKICTGEKPSLTCSKCQKVFKQNYERKNHESTCGLERPDFGVNRGQSLWCSKCKRGPFARNDGRLAHERTCDGSFGGKKAKGGYCSKCGQGGRYGHEWSSDQKRKVHEKTCTGQQKVFKVGGRSKGGYCSKCGCGGYGGAEFARAANRKEHEKTCTG
ncbi:hypothetical protein LTR17_023862 [Elasticomyces elasticus]|nr:hypothetical protein LTR17_023862 [Elasticomyces elasticus]